MDEQASYVQERIHYRFGQVKHAIQALTHSSFANEQGCPGEHNERLEFLGDAVLDLIISEEAIARYPLASEGHLTRIRANLVKEKTLADLAMSLGLDRHVRLGKGEEAQGGRIRKALLADVMEALIGAVFLDGGYGAVREVVLELFAERWPERPDTPGQKDYKSRLQEVTQGLLGDRPAYVLLDSSGPEHEKVFNVQVSLPDGRTFTAQGSSLKKGEQAAAKTALAALGKGGK